MNMPPSPTLPPDWVAMIDKGVSAIVSACSLDMRPSIMRAVGTAIAADGSTVTLYLSRPQSRQLLQDIAASGEVAVVFSQPTSHRTLQLKARHARLRAAAEADLPLLQRYLASMEREVGAVGYAPIFVRAMLAHRLDDVVAIGFTPEQAFDQTPGPRAGMPLPSSP